MRGISRKDKRLVDITRSRLCKTAVSLIVSVNYTVSEACDVPLDSRVWPVFPRNETDVSCGYSSTFEPAVGFQLRQTLSSEKSCLQARNHPLTSTLCRPSHSCECVCGALSSKNELQGSFQGKHQQTRSTHLNCTSANVFVLFCGKFQQQIFLGDKLAA